MQSCKVVWLLQLCLPFLDKYCSSTELWVESWRQESHNVGLQDKFGYDEIQDPREPLSNNEHLANACGLLC